MFDFYKYIETFNSGDDKSMLDQFWVNDLEVWSGRGGNARLLASGKKGFLDFLTFVHVGVRELIRVQVLLQNEANLFAEIDMDFVFLKDRPDYPFGSYRAGERITVKMFCLYFLRGDKIAKLKMASWDPNQGVSVPPTQSFGPPFPL